MNSVMYIITRFTTHRSSGNFVRYEYTLMTNNIRVHGPIFAKA